MRTLHWTKFAELGTVLAPTTTAISQAAQLQTPTSTGCGCGSLSGASPQLKRLTLTPAPR